ncbi:hydroxymethylbilane synthase [Actinoalloteichus hymeniacidonis]|uniref:Porphobilinogen deaminase n=1 Tax=Actinoalloteichus hymeniacidonis TaxID=340345 RepID=A0AAC9HLC7_9PSEU|nr:hydroxymethylbilane synthase [Actinoalloteichus hymeniacidonis]AOS61315.1 hydroxymethylbilane synthase [Actinoalloteichus hymeniacidonis]MBB5910680.1 hydroxymethylbilane synthase [Actinoalloteichus hymeniacidonis]
MNRRIRIGTRGSRLALAQTGWVADQLRAAGADVELVTISTPGDRSMAPIAEIGVGVFTSALRSALHEDKIDVAVHSLKDLPTTPDPGLSLAAVPRREDPRDALVARDGLRLAQLPPGSTVGTGSPRRATQLEALGLGLEVRPLRGNVDTRLRKVADGELDAIVVARAGLARLGLLDVITESLDPLQMLSAPAQGALAVECRVDDVDAEHLIQSTLDDPASRAAVTAERALLAALEAGCSAPVGALAEVVEDLDDEGRVVLRLSLRGIAATPHNDVLRASAIAETTAAEQLGRDVAAELLDLGAAVLSGPEQ